MSITKRGRLPHTNTSAKLARACLSRILHFQPDFLSLGVCPAFASLFLPTGAREDTPFSMPRL